MLQKKMVTHENHIEYQNNIIGGKKKKESWYDKKKKKKSLRTQNLGASMKWWCQAVSEFLGSLWNITTQ